MSESSDVDLINIQASADLKQLPGVQLGDVVGGYEIVDLLGQGGVGAVYRASQPEMGRLVALKIMHRQADAKGIERLRREVQTIGALDHGGIVKVFSLGIDERGLLYVAMELAGGRGLDQLLAERTLTGEQLFIVVASVCDALVHAHSCGIVHKDLKPSNIMVDLHGEAVSIKLLDFGLAAFLDSQGQAAATTATSVAGSPLYMSPEQCTGKSVDARTDVYSLGCIIYECICGSPPFVAQSAMEALSCHINQAVSFPVGLPESWSALLNRCLSKQPDTRFQSVADLKQELLRCGNSLPVCSALTKEPRKKSLVVAGVILLVVVALGLFLYPRESLHDRATAVALSEDVARKLKSLDGKSEMKVKKVSAEGVKISDRAIAACPEYWGGWYQRASCNQYLGNWAKSTADLKQAIRLDPNQADPYLMLANLSQRNPEEVIPLANKALELRVSDVRAARECLVSAYLRLGQYEKVIEQVEQMAHEEFHVPSNVRVERGRAFFAMKNYVRALDDLSFAIDIHKRDYENSASLGQFLFERSLVLRAMHNDKAADADLSLALNRNYDGSTMPDWLRNLYGLPPQSQPDMQAATKRSVRRAL